MFPTGVAGFTPRPIVTAWQSVSQSLPASTWTKVLYQSVLSDPLGLFANSRFTVPVAGAYMITAGVHTVAAVDGTRAILSVWKNGGGPAGTYANERRMIDGYSGAVGNIGISGSCVFALVAGDYIEVFAYLGAALDTVNRVDVTAMSIFRLS